MNLSDIYVFGLFKNKFKEIYNKNKFNFQINNNTLSNIINKCKNILVITFLRLQFGIIQLTIKIG